jgi:hypothetical protein
MLEDNVTKAILSLVTANKSFGLSPNHEIIYWSSEADQPTKEEIDTEIEKQIQAIKDKDPKS